MCEHSLHEGFKQREQPVLGLEVGAYLLFPGSLKGSLGNKTDWIRWSEAEDEVSEIRSQIMYSLAGH